MDGNTSWDFSQIDEAAKAVLGKKTIKKLLDDDVPRIIDDEFTKLGYSPTARESILGNLGRENAWNVETIFKGHKDPANNADNLGIISWQGDRRTKLINYLQKNNGSLEPSEQNLRLMARFMDEELKTEYGDVYKTVKDPSATLPNISRAMRNYIRYVPNAPYNTPDNDYDTVNNRKWAERAKKLGLASPWDFSQIDKAAKDVFNNSSWDFSQIDASAQQVLGAKKQSPLVSSATTEVIPQPKDEPNILPNLSNAPVQTTPVENQGTLLNNYQNYLQDAKNPFLNFEDWRAKFAPTPSVTETKDLKNLKPNSGLLPEEQADLDGLTKSRVVAQPSWGESPQDFELRKKYKQFITDNKLPNDQSSIEKFNKFLNTPEKPKADESSFQEWRKFKKLPDSEQSRAQFEKELATADKLNFGDTIDVSGTFTGVVGQNQTRPQQRQTVPTPQTTNAPQSETTPDSRNPAYSWSPIKSKQFAPLALDWSKKDKNQTYIGFLKQEAIRRLVAEGVDYESAEKAVNETVWSTNGQTAATESEYVELAKKNQLGRVILSSDLYERAQTNRLQRLDAENRKLKVKDRVAAGEDPFDAMFQEGFITPEQATSLRYEQKLEEEREIEARRKFLEENNYGDRYKAFELSQGLITPQEAQEYGNKRAQESLEEILARYGTVQKYYQEKERIEKEYEFRYMARPTEFALNIGRYFAKIPATIGKGVSILSNDFNPLDAVGDATKSPFYQFWDGWSKRIEAAKNPDLKDELVVGQLADGLGQLGAQALLTVFTGVGGLALPLLEGGVSQYEESSKGGATRLERIIATSVGALAAVPESLLNATYLRNLTGGKLRLFLDKIGERLFGTLSKQMSEQQARQATSQFLTQFLANAPKNFAVEGTQEYSEDVINGIVGKYTYKPQSTWSDIFIPTEKRLEGYFVAGLIGAFGGNINLAVQTLQTSELEKADQVLANALQQNLIDQEQAESVARAVAEEIKKRNAQINPTGSIAELSQKAVENSTVAELSQKATETFLDQKMSEATNQPTKQIAFNKDLGVVEILGEENGQTLVRITEGARQGETVIVPQKELVTNNNSQPRVAGLAFENVKETIPEEVLKPGSENLEPVRSNTEFSSETNFEQNDLSEQKPKRLPRQVIGQTVEIENAGKGRIADIRDGQFIVDFNPKTNKAGEIVYQSRKFFSPKELSIGGVSLTEYKPPKPKKTPERTQFTAEDFAAKPKGRVLSEEEQSDSDVLKKIRSGIAQTGGGGKILKFTPRENDPKQKVFTPQNEEFALTPRVIDDADILTSFDEGYPEILQPRNRNSLASDAQVMGIAQKLIPEKLDDNPNTNDGRPIVVPVEVNGQTKYALITGNGRMMAVRLAREQYPESYQNYADFAAAKDLSSTAPNPVYVGILDNSNLDDGDLRSLAVDSNKSQQSAMSPVEQARVDAEALDDSIMKRFAMTDDGEIDTKMNRGFITEFFSRNVTENERGFLIDKDGALTADGVNRIKRAIIAKAFGQTSVGMEVLSKIIESPDDAVKNITTALTRTAPRFADLKTAIEARNAFPELDITEEMAIAFNQFAELRKTGTDVKTFVNQQNLPGSESLTDFEKNLLELFNHYSKAARQLTVVLNNYLDGAAAAGNPNQTNLFGESAISPDPFDLTVAAVEVFEEENGVSDERKLKFTEFGQIPTRRETTRNVETVDPVETQIEEPTNRTTETQETQSEMVAESGRLPAGSLSVKQIPTVEQKVAPDDDIVGFETSKGSTYTVNGQSTQRNKSLHAEHDPKDVGLKKPSAVTYYGEDAQVRLLTFAGQDRAKGGDAVVRVKNNPDGTVTAEALYWNPVTQKWFNSSKNYPEISPILQTTPKLGLHPLELWKPEKGGENVIAYRGTHGGNAITKLIRKPKPTQQTSVEQKATPESKSFKKNSRVGFGFGFTKRGRIIESKTEKGQQIHKIRHDNGDVTWEREQELKLFPERTETVQSFEKLAKESANVNDFVNKILDDEGLSDRAVELNLNNLAAFWEESTGKTIEKPTTDRWSQNDLLANKESDSLQQLPQEQSENDVLPANETDQTQQSLYGKSNTVFTEDRANIARELLRKKLKGGQFNVGLDPEIAQAGIELAGYHIEAGARKFAAFAEKMLDDLGSAVRPYLKSWYLAVKYYPNFDNSNMDNESDIDNYLAKTSVDEIVDTPNFDQTTTPTSKPFGDNLSPRDLFGNPLSPETDQTNLFDIESIQDQADIAENQKNLNVFGNQLGERLNDYKNNELTKIARQTAQTIIKHRVTVESKGQAIQDFLSDTMAALEAVHDAEITNVPFEQYINQGSFFDSVELSPNQREIYDKIIKNKFASLLNEVLREANENSEYNENAEYTDRNLEQNSENISASNTFRETSVSDERISDDEGAFQTDEGIPSDRDQLGNLESLFGNLSVVGGTSSTSTISEPTNFESSDDRDTGRSDGTTETRISDDNESGRNNSAQSVRASNLTREQKQAAQRSAELVQVTLADADNIAETLPILYPEQQADVLFAEQAFYHSTKPKLGVLFTNSTGTGKTFTGLGIVKRFQKRGKDNILIVAPSQEILNAWQSSAGHFQLSPAQIEDTESNGQSGIVLTTYANLQQNPSLIERRWDLIVTDEAHKISSNQAGELTGAAQALRAITLHKRGKYDYGRQAAIKEIYKADALTREIEELRAQIDRNQTDFAFQARINRELSQKSRELTEVNEQINSIKEAAHIEFDRRVQSEEKTPVLFLSATPFAYKKSIEYAEGYLFDFDEGMPDPDRHLAYNEPNNREAFFVKHFGFRMRYNKLTTPDADVDSSLMERQFNTWLKKQGVLSGRMLTVDADYSRDFVLIEDAIGSRIDEGLQFLKKAHDGKYAPLAEIIEKQFNYHARMYLLEAIKAKAAVPIIQKHLDLGRKVVVFHNYNKGGGFHPFRQNFAGQTATVYRDGKSIEINLKELYEEFAQERSDLIDLDLSGLTSPIVRFKEEFNNALFVNGTVSKRNNRENISLFNADNSRADLIVVQSDKGQAGISLHDTTGRHQRVLINLGLPVKPVAAIQTEGRIYRLGSVSNAIQIYLNTGTGWEQSAFARTIAERASTAENLALGEEARMLKESIIDSFETPIENYEPSDKEGVGGKEKDKSNASLITDWERAKTFYFANQKKTSKNKAREGVDYFPTPEPVGLKMVEFANVGENETLLEPSAGHGAIARWFPENTRNTFIEPETDLINRVMMTAQGGTTNRYETIRFEDLHIGNKYDAIIMNPPYGTGGKTAIDHLEKAIGHLRNGGRIVALIPEGGMTDKRLNALMEKEVSKDIYKIADISLPSVTFSRAATSVKTHIVVLEKQINKSDVNNLPSEIRKDFSSASTIKEFFDRLETFEISERVKPTRSTTGYALNERGSIIPIRGEHVLSEVLNPDGTTDLTPADESKTSLLEKAEFTHSRDNYTVFVAKLTEQVSDEKYKELLGKAKSFGGWYNKFGAKYGAIKGFAFRSDEQRNNFVDSVNEITEQQSDNTVLSIAEESARREAVRLLKNIPVMDLIQSVEVTRQGDRIKLNLPAMEFLRRTFEQIDIDRGQRSFGDDNLAPSFLGLFTDETKLNSVIEVLNNFAKDAKTKGWNEESAAAAEIADSIKSALKIGNGTAVFYVLDEKLPQELFHQASFLSATEKALTKRHAHIARLDNHPAMKIADREFFSKQREYSLENLQKTRKLSAKSAADLRKAILREELVAWIAEGNPDTLRELGLENREDLADEYMLDWFESYADKIYNDAKKEGKTPDEAKKEVANRLKRFEEVDYAKQFVEKTIEAERNRAANSTRTDGRTDAKSAESSDTRGTPEKNSGIAPTGSIFEREPEVRRNLDGDMGRGEKKSASLPATQRAAGIGADDVLYTVFGDRAAQREAEKLINENGIDGTIKILKQLAVPDAHHAIASFAIQRTLFDEADRIEETNPKEAAALRKTALELGAAEAMKSVKAGRYIRAAGVIQKTVQGVLFTAQKAYQEKFGAGALLPDALRDRIEQKARVAESELAQVESLEKQIKSLKDENNSLKKALSGNENFRRASKQTLANRKRLVTQIKNRHQSEFEKAMERLRKRIQTQVQESVEDISVMSIFDENSIAPELLEDYATVGAMILTDGLSAPKMMLPSDFDTAMIAEFGESIRPHLQVIHQESLRLRNKWLADLTKEKTVKGILKEFGENLSDAEIEAILEERTDELRRRALIRSMHTLRAERGTNAQSKQRLSALEEIIAKNAKTEAEAAAAVILAKRKPSAQEFYRELEALGIKNADARNALRAGEELLEKAKKILAKEEADKKRELSSALAENEQEFKELENLRLEAQRRARQSQKEIGKELKRISTGEIKFYAGLALETLNTPRAMMSSLDASFIARQGGWFLFSRPKQQKEAFSAMVGALKNSLDEKGFVEVMAEMEKNPYFELAKKSGVDFASLGQHGDFSITAGEEEFRNNLFGMLSDATKDTKIHSVNPARLPNFIIRKSDETYTAFLDAQRLGVFAASAEYFNSIGLTPETHPREYKALAEYINDATGRSTVGNAKLTRILMELPLFSPRFTVSRFKLLYKSTVGLPFLPPATRKVVAKDAGAFYGATAAVLALAYLAGLGVSLDWDDDDFLKVKIGQNRYDLFVGMQQPARAMLRLVQSASREFIGQEKSGGLLRDNAPDEMKYDFLNVPSGIPARFLRSKLSPIPSLAVDRILGKDFAGNEFNWSNAVLTRIAPIGVTDVAKGTYNNGAWGFVGAFPTLLGVGYSNYKDRPEEPVTPAEKFATKINSMRFQSKAQTAEEKQIKDRMAEIRARARRGEDVRGEIKEMHDAGQITTRQANNLIKGLDETFFESKIKNMPSEMLQEVRKVANDGERFLIDEILKNRENKKQKAEKNAKKKPLNFNQ